MLPIYYASSFDQILIGGSTRPWLIIVLINGQPYKYVVKVYKKNHNDEYYATSNEVISAITASFFGLKTPTPALIEFSDNFIKTLPLEIQTELNTKDPKIKFGCELIEGNFQFQQTSDYNKLKKYDCASIYAFDNLIKNADRTIQKPNILFKGKELYLIDHELTFKVNQDTIHDFQNDKWIYFSRNHIFYNYLRDRPKEEQRNFFEDFIPLLSGMNIDLLDPFGRQLIDQQLYSEEQLLLIKNYLWTIKQNPERFVKLLKHNLL